MRLNTAILHQPPEHVCVTIGRIGSKALGMQGKAILRTIQHKPHRADFGLTDRHGGLDIDKVIGAVGEKGSVALGACLTRCGIRRGDRFWLHRRCRSEGAVIEGFEIFLRRTTYEIRRRPFVEVDLAITAGVGPDEGTVCAGSLSPHKPFRDAALQNVFE